MKNILEFLEATAEQFPGKVGFVDESNRTTFAEMENGAKALASALNHKFGIELRKNSPVAIFLDRGVHCIEAMLGTLYAGCFYTVIDVHSPASRASHIVNALEPAAIITDEANLDFAKSVYKGKNILLFEEVSSDAIDSEFIAKRRSEMIDADPMYVLFTSGSSGTPKGAVLSHRSVISYVNWVSEEFGFSEDTNFGSQTPLYFSMSISDLFSTVKCGCTYNIIPKQLFTFPLKLVEYLNEHEINTIYWVPSAMGIVADWNTFEYLKPSALKNVLFAGEVMPVKRLNYWIKHLPDCQYANLFGPTETTDICSFYVVDRELSETESLPIGKSCNNCDIVLINDTGKESAFGEEGEIFVRGSFVADGYYNDSERTAKAFPQNPLNKAYPERVYRTGDIAKYNERGELIYINRKDFQVKRHGYRIELGEIEAAAILVDGTKKVAAIFDKSQEQILVLYEGKIKNEKEFLQQLSERIPTYMRPDRAIRLKRIPLNANGKIDREALKREYIAE